MTYETHYIGDACDPGHYGIFRVVLIPGRNERIKARSAQEALDIANRRYHGLRHALKASLIEVCA